MLITLSCSYLSRRLTSMKTSLTCRMRWMLLLAGWLLTFCASLVLRLSSCFLVFDLNSQNSQSCPSFQQWHICCSGSFSSQSWYYLWFSLNFEDQISSVSRACFYHIRDLRRIRSVINFNTAKTSGTSFVHLISAIPCTVVFQKLN